MDRPRRHPGQPGHDRLPQCPGVAAIVHQRDRRRGERLRDDGRLGRDTTFTVSGYVKTQGVAAQVAVQDFGGGYNAFGWQQAFFLNPDKDWTKFTKEITFPPGAGHIALVLWVKGKGKAWLSNVKITDIHYPAGQP